MSDETQKIELLQETKRNLNAGKIVFSRFELLRELGSGGMGVVWLAKDLDVEGNVALKFLPGLVRDPIAERDLRDEVKNARDLVHENIVSVRTLHKDEASIAVEMEYVDGPNVRMLVRDTANRFLEVDKAAPIVRGLCLAIDHAWTPPRRLVHRDIKPANMLVTSTGDVKVVDFGIAHTVSETVTRLTGKSNSDRVVGTLPYMSPQQLKGEVHHNNDVYSIGATIYEILTGTVPFRATDAAVLTQQINHDVPVTMTERRKQMANESGRQLTGTLPIPRIWEEVVASCLAKDAAKRPPTARAIAVRLGLAEELHPGMGVGAGKSRSRQTTIAIAAAAGLAVCAGAWIYFSRPDWIQHRKKEVVPTPWVVTPAVSTPATATVPGVTPPVATAPVSAPAVAAPPVATPVVSTPGTTKTGAAAKSTPSPPRQSWQLVTTETVKVVVSRENGGIEFEGELHAGEKRNLPLDKTLLIDLKEGKGLGWEVDGAKQTAPASEYNRWKVTVPKNAESQVAVEAYATEIDKMVGPFVKKGEITKLEEAWLRAALAGEKEEPEGALGRKLFAKNDPITIGEWRARTSLKFKPDLAALTADAEDPQRARAIDLPLRPGAFEMRLLRIEPGTFQRGSPDDELGHNRNVELPHGPATIAKPYFIGIYEVTQEQMTSVTKQRDGTYGTHPKWPVDSVSVNKLTLKTGFIGKLNDSLKMLFDGQLVADLPTNDEWEYACRAGTTTALNSDVNLTNKDNDPALKLIAYYNKSGEIKSPQDVGKLEPNRWGLYDMHGNLEELTKEGASRGGSAASRAEDCRSAVRVIRSKDFASNQTGFRLVLRFKESK